MSADAFLARAAIPADELREKLMGFIAHEVRNPLASCLWSVEMLARKAAGGDPRTERLANLAYRSVRRLRVLLEDLFALERLPERVPPGQTDVKAAVERAIGPHDLEPEGVPAEVQGPEGLVAPLDPTVLDRLLHACMRRSAHAGSDAPIQVLIEEQGDFAIVSIRRPGIDATTVDPPMLTPGGSEGGGTTLALYVARLAAQRLGVDFSVDDEGDASVIHLKLPLIRHH